MTNFELVDRPNKKQKCVYFDEVTALLKTLNTEKAIIIPLNGRKANKLGSTLRGYIVKENLKFHSSKVKEDLYCWVAND